MNVILVKDHTPVNAQYGVHIFLLNIHCEVAEKNFRRPAHEIRKVAHYVTASRKQVLTFWLTSTGLF